MYSRIPLLFAMCLVLAIPGPLAAQNIEASTLVSEPRIAPGEGLPVRTKLTNVSSTRRVDVVLTYRILDERGTGIARESETVAIDTSATVFHVFALPRELVAGRYTLEVEAMYPEQRYPARASFAFFVEPKIFGVFRSDLLLFSSLAVVLLVGAVAAFVFIERRSVRQLIAARDFSHVRADERVYYEIVSDVLQQLRLKLGDRALSVVADVPGLELDKRTGKVQRLSHDPATVVAEMITRYERATSKKVGFTLSKKRVKALLSG